MNRFVAAMVCMVVVAGAPGPAGAGTRDEVERHWRLALRYVKAGMPTKALMEAKVVLKLDPSHQPAIDLIAREGSASGTEALSATVAGGSNAVFFLEEARRAYRENRPDVARQNAGDALKEDPGNAEAARIIAALDEEAYREPEVGGGDILRGRFENGIGFYRQEQWEEALQAFSDAMSVSPSHEQSLTFYQRTRVKAESARALSLMEAAKADIGAGKQEDAKAKLKEAQKLAPENEEILALLKSVGGDSETEERLKKSRELYLKGKARYEAQDFRGAIEVLTDSVRMNSGNKEAADLLAKAKENSKVSSKEKKERIAMLHQDALMSFQAGDYERAYKIYKEILTLDNKDERAMQNLKIIESKLGKS